MAAVLDHEREVNQPANTLQSALEIVILRTVAILQSGRQYGRNTAAEVAHFLSLPLCNFTIGLFWYAESGYDGISFQISSNACCHFCFFRNPGPHSIICLNRAR